MFILVNGQGDLFDKRGTYAAGPFLIFAPNSSEKKSGFFPLPGKAFVSQAMDSHTSGVAQQGRITKITHLAMKMACSGFGKPQKFLYRLGVFPQFSNGKYLNWSRLARINTIMRQATLP